VDLIKVRRVIDLSHQVNEGTQVYPGDPAVRLESATTIAAGGVNVLLEPRGNSLVLIIEDDGVGFDPNKHTLKEKGVSMGLIGMQERAALVGGRLEIESAGGKGTTIYAKVPILALRKGEEE